MCAKPEWSNTCLRSSDNCRAAISSSGVFIKTDASDGDIIVYEGLHNAADVNVISLLWYIILIFCFCFNRWTEPHSVMRHENVRKSEWVSVRWSELIHCISKSTISSIYESFHLGLSFRYHYLITILCHNCAKKKKNPQQAVPSEHFLNVWQCFGCSKWAFYQ